MADKKARHLHLVGATGAIRTAVYNGSDHLVVPVVAMVEGVVWASNSDVPEFVAAEELAQTPHQWNGRGAFAGHPKDGDMPVTANTPRTLEKSFGVIFDTASADRILKTRRLEFNVYIDPKKARAVGPAEEAVVNRLLADERVEVSVGAYVETDDVDGRFNGKEYHGAWRNIVSDHIAFLAEGEEGACSVAAGCGAPRAAVRHLVTAQGIRREENMEKLKANATREEVVAYLQARDAASGVSDRDLRQVIDAALRAVEPGYMGIEVVYPDDKFVVYYVMPGEEWKTKRRGYKLSADATEATLKDDAVEVKITSTMTYEPITAAARPPQKKAAKCGCKTATCGCKEKNMNRAEIIQSLVTDKHSGFNETDTAMLESASDARLEEFRGAADARKTEAAAFTRLETEHRNAIARIKVQEDRLRDMEKGMSEEEWLAKAPAHFKEILERDKIVDDQYRASIIAQLKDLGAHKEEELKAMKTKDLEILAKYAHVSVPDFSAARQAPRALMQGNTGHSYAPPDTYGLKKKQPVQ